MDTQSRELRNTQYELFILAISFLSLFNMLLIWLRPETSAAKVAVIINAALTALFLFDFLLRLYRAESKLGYFFSGLGWADLLGSLWYPGFRLFRLARVVQVTRAMRRRYGARAVVRGFRAERANTAFGAVALLVILVLQWGGTAMLHYEAASPQANIKTPGDALWWGIVTIATVGYGDRYPVTPMGRVVGVLTILSGVGLFGVITGFLAHSFIEPRTKQATQPAPGDGGSQQAVLAEIQRLAAQHDRDSADLRARLERIEGALASMPATEHRREQTERPAEGIAP